MLARAPRHWLSLIGWMFTVFPAMGRFVVLQKKRLMAVLSGTGGGLVNLVQTVYLTFNRARKIHKLGLFVILGVGH